MDQQDPIKTLLSVLPGFFLGGAMVLFYMYSESGSQLVYLLGNLNCIVVLFFPAIYLLVRPELLLGFVNLLGYIGQKLEKGQGLFAGNAWDQLSRDEKIPIILFAIISAALGAVVLAVIWDNGVAVITTLLAGSH